METPDPNADPSNITEERAARRFHQIRHLQEQILKLDTKVESAKLKLSALKEERDGYVQRIFAAARDEGELPLFEDL